MAVAEGLKELGGAGDPYVAVAAEVAGSLLEWALQNARDQERSGKISKDRLEKLEREHDQLAAKINDTQRTHFKFVATLTEMYGWKHNEVGYDSTETETAPFRAPKSEKGNVDGRIRSLKAWSQRRPHDIFATLDYCQLAGQQLLDQSRDGKVDLGKTSGELLALAKQCRAAVGDVPAGKAFDTYRALLLIQADRLAHNAERIKRLDK